ncbi:MAG: pyridoxal 5'-phosphate synthase glutaminase subunit PdxT [Spirochaetales bacterium]|nr:pyridoxal 5'-phosphate synthase glutaminase subunit PdxT [Spirochaetales bacterium]
MKPIGVLSLQGGYDPHLKMLARLGVEAYKVSTLSEFDNISGLIIPGGESTTIGKLLVQHNLLEPLRERIRSGLCVFGTCAGLILLAHQAEGSVQPLFDVLDVDVKRNAYGRQSSSFEAIVKLVGENLPPQMAGIFIRAPQIIRIGSEVKVLASYEDFPVAVQQGRIMAASFHPELTQDTALHEAFVKLAQS